MNYSNKQSSLLRELRRMHEANASMHFNQSAQLAEMTQQLKDIKSGIQPSRSGINQDFEPDTSFYKKLANKLDGIYFTASELAVQQRILQSLYFRVLPVRHHAIAEAHKETFRWILNDDPSEGKNIFLRWLEAENGIFWVSGKPGSGKSTLMKFLACHQKTSETVTLWAAPHHCVIAQYYFWSAGTHLQKSLEGLIRSLLFEILRREPKLMSTILPERWERACDSEDEYVEDEASPFWSISELCRAADRLGNWDTVSTRFCFFVDGLDEFSGEHAEIVQVLARIGSSPNIKICVASRPWNIFEDVYGKEKNKKFYLQDLTKDDIKIYTQRKLESHPNWRMVISEYTRCSDLVLDITKKSQGVFLWVYLVVKSLYEGLTNGDDFSTLERRIRRFPEDLDSFFKLMLVSIDPFYYQSMARCFKVALEAREPLTLMCFSFIDQAVRDDDFALHRPVQPMDKYDIFNRHSQMRRRLNGRCKGLLEIEQSPSSMDYLGYRVNFLHRTVRDFLLTRDMTDFIHKYLQEFNVNRTIFQAFVALMKSMPMREDYAGTELELGAIIRETLHYAYRTELETEQADPDLVNEARDTAMGLLTSAGLDPPWESFLRLSISRGLFKYLEQRKDCQAHSRKIVDGSLLRHSLAESVRQSGADDPDLTDIVALILQRGDSSIGLSEKTHINYWLHTLTKTLPESGIDQEWTERQQRILVLLLGHGGRTAEVFAVGDFLRWLFKLTLQQPKRQTWEIWLEMLKSLLDAGADPNGLYHSTTVAESFFSSLLGHYEGGQWIRLPVESLEFLAGIVETLLIHSAQASCFSDGKLRQLFPERLSGPLQDLLDSHCAPTSRAGSFSTLMSWLLAPFRIS